MAKEYYTLSKKEKELMDIFWNSDTPLTRAEILERAEKQKCSWKPNSIHILVNSLLDKKAVQVAGFYLNSRKLGRTFEPAITREEYAVMQVKLAVDQARAEGVAKAEKLVSALIGTSASADELDQILKAIEMRQQELKTQKKKG